MIEVFKTNVKEKEHANMLVEQIHKIFIDYRANFDLEDCDNILRIKSKTGIIHVSSLVDLLKKFGFHAEVLPDIPQTTAPAMLPGNSKLSSA